MLISLSLLINQFNLKIRGILHIGAHECEELSIYNQNGIETNSIIWIEGNPDIVKKTRSRYPDVKLIEAIVSDIDDKVVTFNVSNNGQSSSILELGVHKRYHPTIYYVNKFEGKTRTVKSLYDEHKIPYDFANFLNIDIQGAELLALKGMGNLLEHFDYLYLEVNADYLYVNCALVDEIDKYLLNFGFNRVVTHMTKCKWGDALYIKNQINK